jgi:hypothetical protein
MLKTKFEGIYTFSSERDEMLKHLDSHYSEMDNLNRQMYTFYRERFGECIVLLDNLTILGFAMVKKTIDDFYVNIDLIRVRSDLLTHQQCIYYALLEEIINYGIKNKIYLFKLNDFADRPEELINLFTFFGFEIKKETINKQGQKDYVLFLRINRINRT